MRASWIAWKQFWFFTPVYGRISLFRFLFGFSALLFYCTRQFELEMFFSNAGVLPLDAAKGLFDGAYHSPFFVFPEGFAAVQALHVLFLACLLGVGLGIFTRWFALMGLFLHVLFEQRDFLVAYGADKVTACWLFYLILADSDREWSLRKFIWKTPKKRQDLFTPLAIRLIQVHLCVIYAYSGLEKLKGYSWWSGDALWNLLSNSNAVPFGLDFVAGAPVLLAFSAFAVLFWEIYFPFAVWMPAIRRQWLLFGLVFHGLIGVLMNLQFFAIFMVLPYLLFWPGRRGKAPPNPPFSDFRR